MSKRLEMDRLLWDLRYQLMHGTHTFGTCSREGCNDMARGASVCGWCLAEDIDTLVNSDGLGDKMRNIYASAMSLEGHLLEMAEDA